MQASNRSVDPRLSNVVFWRRVRCELHHLCVTDHPKSEVRLFLIHEQDLYRARCHPRHRPDPCEECLKVRLIEDPCPHCALGVLAPAPRCTSRVRLAHERPHATGARRHRRGATRRCDSEPLTQLREQYFVRKRDRNHHVRYPAHGSSMAGPGDQHPAPEGMYWRVVELPTPLSALERPAGQPPSGGDRCSGVGTGAPPSAKPEGGAGRRSSGRILEPCPPAKLPVTLPSMIRGLTATVRFVHLVHGLQHLGRRGATALERDDRLGATRACIDFTQRPRGGGPDGRNARRSRPHRA